METAATRKKIGGNNMPTTKKEAINQYADQFDSIPTSLITKAYNHDDGTAEQLNLLAGGSLTCRHCGAYPDDDDNPAQPCDYCHKSEGYDSQAENWPAMWGWMFHPKEGLDEEWIRNHPELPAQAGFLVYDCDEAGILLGVDGAGYSFHDTHWAKLYDLRGLHWHDEED